MPLETEGGNNRLRVKMPEKFGADTAEELLELLQAEGEGEVVLDFRQTRHFEALQLMRCLGVAGKLLRSSNRTFYVANTSAEISAEIRLNGLDSTVKFLATDQVPPAQRKSALNVEFLNPIIEATMKTLQTQCALELRVDDRPFLKGQKPLPAVDIAAIIGVVSPEFTGSISLCFGKDTFLGIMEGMLGERSPEITPELQDGAGELLNIIFGQAKVVLNEKGFAIEKAIPSVVAAQDLRLRQFGTGPALILPFASHHGPFFLEVALAV